MRNTRRILIASTLLVAATLSIAQPVDVRVVGSVPVAIHSTQWAEISRQVALTETQLAELTKISEEQLKHSRKAEGMPNAELAETFTKVSEALAGMKAISYLTADADVKFREKYPQYSEALEEQLKSSDKKREKFFADRVKELQQDFNDQLARRLKAIGVVVKDVEQEKLIIDQLLQKSASAEGTLQALQVANAIAAHSAYSLQRLQVLIAQTQDSQLAWQTYTQQQQQEARARRARVVEQREKVREGRVARQNQAIETAKSAVPGSNWGSSVPAPVNGNGYGGRAPNGGSGNCQYWNGTTQGC